MIAAFVAGTTMLQQVVERGFSLTLISHRLPFWFLVFALFLPRVSLVVAWFQGVLIPFHLQGLIPLLFAILLPRVLILFLIYVDQGLSLWFVIHLVVALLVWGGGGHQMQRRRYREV
ncbi:MAG: hypothetical protein JWQ42_4052 [Edaphobacter sp.]|jgi:hypothetical protein|nr:hypothetical protein [Edaphobacter sp.]